MHTDPIADMLTRIRNAQRAGHEEVKVPFSRVKFDLAKTLASSGFVLGIEEGGKGVKKTLVIKLKYENGQPAITEIKRMSKPGQRLYIAVNKIRPIRQGFGVTILSTSKGIMSDKEARKQKVGGEIICQVY